MRDRGEGWESFRGVPGVSGSGTREEVKELTKAREVMVVAIVRENFWEGMRERAERWSEDMVVFELKGIDQGKDEPSIYCDQTRRSDEWDYKTFQ